MLEPDKWIFNQLHGRILRSSVPSQEQQQNYRDVLSFRHHSSVHCSLQYLQKVYGCCGGFFVTVNLWMYVDEHVHEPVHNLWRLKITAGIGTELLFDLLLPKKQLPGITECIIFCFCFYRCKDTHCIQRMTDDCMRKREKNVRVGICSSSPLKKAFGLVISTLFRVQIVGRKKPFNSKMS